MLTITIEFDDEDEVTVACHNIIGDVSVDAAVTAAKLLYGKKWLRIVVEVINSKNTMVVKLND